MLSSLLSIHQTDYSKYAAWLTVALLSLAGARFLKGLVVSALMKLYEIIIQKNGVA